MLEELSDLIRPKIWQLLMPAGSFLQDEIGHVAVERSNLSISLRKHEEVLLTCSPEEESSWPFGMLLCCHHEFKIFGSGEITQVKE